MGCTCVASLRAAPMFKTWLAPLVWDRLSPMPDETQSCTEHACFPYHFLQAIMMMSGACGGGGSSASGACDGMVVATGTPLQAQRWQANCVYN